LARKKNGIFLTFMLFFRHFFKQNGGMFGTPIKTAVFKILVAFLLWYFFVMWVNYL